VSRTTIALVLCLLVAGCAAPTAQTQDPAAGTDAPITTDGSASGTTSPETTDSTTDETAAVDTTSTGETTAGEVENDGISVRGGSLPVDPETIFDRTTALLGGNVSPPTRIVVRSAAEVAADTDGTATTGGQPGARSFGGVMGIGAGNEAEAAGDDADGNPKGDDSRGDDSDDGESGDGGVTVAAYAPSADSVVVNQRMTIVGRERALERTLAHEFVHTVQFRQNALVRVQRALDLRYSYSLDRYLTYVSVVEGTAAFVADAYDERYLAGEGSAVVSAERYRSAPSGVKVSLARYYFGSRYVASRFDSSQNVSAVYDDPPRTTEQLLHQDANGSDANGSEEPRFLALQVRPGENRTVGSRTTNGELFTRIALGTELNESRAAEAAAGWGSDELAVVELGRRSVNRSFVWATRWDSPAEADEFAAALAAYLDSRARQPTAGASGAESAIWRDDSLSFRTERVGDETVVLLVGEEPFVRSATVSGANASVSISA
jgi:hypothetical protein